MKTNNSSNRFYFSIQLKGNTRPNLSLEYARGNTYAEASTRLQEKLGKSKYCILSHVVNQDNLLALVREAVEFVKGRVTDRTPVEQRGFLLMEELERLDIAYTFDHEHRCPASPWNVVPCIMTDATPSYYAINLRTGYRIKGGLVGPVIKVPID